MFGLFSNTTGETYNLRKGKSKFEFQSHYQEENSENSLTDSNSFETVSLKITILIRQIKNDSLKMNFYQSVKI